MTIASMAKNSSMLYSIMQKTNSTSTSAADWISGQSSSAEQTTASSTDWLTRSISTGLTTSTAQTSLLDIISQRLSEQKSDIAALEDYSKKQSSFSENFSKLSGALKKSAVSLQTDFTAASKTTTTSTTTTTTTGTDATGKLISSIKDFATNYNNMTQFFKDNSKLSTNIKNLAASFSDTKYNSRAYASIGIAVDSSGKLSVDEDKLRSSLQNDATKVENLLGKSGLSAKAAKKTDAAINISDRLYPSISLKTKNNFLDSSSLLASGLTLDFYW